MPKQRVLVVTCMVLLVGKMGAQTTVTTSGGTSNRVPVFTGSATVGNSPIAVSGSSVGIGTTSPATQLHLYGSGNQVLTLQSTNGSYPGLNIVNTVGKYSNQLDGVNAGLYWFNGSARQMTLTQSGSLGIGTVTPGAKLEVNGNLKLTSGSGASITFADGTAQATAWTGVLCGGDYAESVDAVGDRSLYGPGDVLVIAPGNEGDVEKSAEPYSTLVAGVFSTKPGLLGRRQQTPKSVDELPMAMIGIVPTKVNSENGPIRRGDLLVTSSTPGYAMKGTDRERMMGAIVGKALGKLDSGTGIIDVLVSLQ